MIVELVGPGADSATLFSYFLPQSVPVISQPDNAND